MDRSGKDAQMVDMTSQVVGEGSTAPSNKPKNDKPNMTPTNDMKMRITMGAWHPKDNTFAVAKHNSLFIYTEKRSITTSDKKLAREREREMMMQQ